MFTKNDICRVVVSTALLLLCTFHVVSAQNMLTETEILNKVYDPSCKCLKTNAGGSVVQASKYGVVCDGSTDTTTAMQTAIAASKSGTTGLRLTMPLTTGNCIITSTLTVANVTAWELDGNNVKFEWRGASTTTPMFMLQDTNRVHMHHFQVAASTAFLLESVLRMENITGGTVTPSANLFNNIIIECTNGGCTNGIHLSQGTGGDNNNEFNTFYNVRISNYAAAAVQIDHSQSKTNVFQDFEMSGNGLGGKGINLTQGSFRCLRCRGGGNTVDFYVTGSNDLLTITDGNFENSGRLLETPNSSGADMPIEIVNTRWAISNFLNADNKAIIYLFRGPFRMEGNKFEPASANKALIFQWNAGGNFGSFVAIGNYIGSTVAQPFTGLPPTLQQSNLINRNDGNGVVPLASHTINYMVATQTITAGATIAADACGTVKRITAASPVTTSTSNTFTAPGAWLVGCKMTVRNVGSNTITLSNNANFKAAGAVDLPMPANSGIEVTLIGDTTASVWWQTSPLVQN